MLVLQKDNYRVAVFAFLRVDISTACPFPVKQTKEIKLNLIVTATGSCSSSCPILLIAGGGWRDLARPTLYNHFSLTPTIAAPSLIYLMGCISLVFSSR